MIMNTKPTTEKKWMIMGDEHNHINVVKQDGKVANVHEGTGADESEDGSKRTSLRKSQMLKKSTSIQKEEGQEEGEELVVPSPVNTNVGRV